MPATIWSAFDTAVMSMMSARAQTGCMASVTGLFQPSITTATFSPTISLARVTPTAGVLSSSLAMTVSLRPFTPPLALTISAATCTAWNTPWPLGPAGPDSGTITPTLIGSPCARAGIASEAIPAAAPTVSVASSQRLEAMMFPLVNGRLFSAGDCAAEGAALSTARQAQMVAQGRAGIVGAKQAALLQDRHDRSAKASNWPGKKGGMTLKPSAAPARNQRSSVSAICSGCRPAADGRAPPRRDSRARAA